MARKTRWEVNGQVITSADVRRWMQAVAARVPKERWPEYIKNYDVLSKIATQKAAGTYDQVVKREAARNAVRVRAPRRLGTLARLRQAWLEAANEGTCEQVDLGADFRLQELGAQA